jgi:hypothetical protein|tara:strand:- start:98 stop:274 length:177 start_codon:yes stop_codon:yes gene_type:complete
MNRKILKILANPIKAAKEVRDKANLNTKEKEAIIKKLLRKKTKKSKKSNVQQRKRRAS